MNIEAFIKSVDWAAWTQAIASVVAIVYAGKIATNQAKSQYDNSLKLQLESEQNKIFTLTVAINEIAKNTASRIRYVKDKLGDDKKLCDVINKSEYYDHDCLQDIIESIKDIPLHELPSAELVTTLMVLTSTLRQLNIQIEKAIIDYRSMNAIDKSKFFLTIDQIVISTEKEYQHTLKIVDQFKRN